ncbi:hypothetical protein GCM10008932_22100 [Alkalibacterium iburiense]|uniref:Uncharacterized protein n=1 Tax=Alkalibacterium iburiense TaxID=290589 RepID=A0ABN3NS72_9LACT
MADLFIDFYRGKDEEAFLSAWQEKFGQLTEDEIDELFAEIAEAIDKAVKDGTHKIGDPFVYKEVTVGTSDFNAFHSLYVFEEGK